MWIVIQIENHPDRLIEDMFGPFNEYDKAKSFAVMKEQSSSNFNGKHRLYDFNARELNPPDLW